MTITPACPIDELRSEVGENLLWHSRRQAERLSGAINELAGEALVRAHHGSVAAPRRKEIEERLKMGTLRGLVATSSLELGIDMGTIDLVIQIEAPPSVASGFVQEFLRTFGRAGPTAARSLRPPDMRSIDNECPCEETAPAHRCGCLNSRDGNLGQARAAG
jgi:ATP-dependent Lhr-like helicase